MAFVGALNGLLALGATLLFVFASTANGAPGNGFLQPLWPFPVLPFPPLPTSPLHNPFGPSNQLCPTGFANFGDSLTDTGNALSLFPFILDPENPPYGQTFFGAPAKRYSDGRLVTDFFSLAFRVKLLDPYIKATSFEYQTGINFAQAGATAVPSTVYPPQNPVSVYPVQLNQFQRWFKSVLTTESEPACANFYPSLPANGFVDKWLYTIEIGGNDLINAFRGQAPNPNFATFGPTVITPAVGGILQTIITLYQTGARKFLIFGIPAQGCSTVLLTLFPNLPTDAMGCIIPINAVAQAFNTALQAGIASIQPNLPGASIAFFDYYAANIQILQTPAAYGFNPAVVFTACCGAPGVGTLNYNPAVTCGRPGSNTCANPNQYVIWDGVHFTDNFYRVIATFALNGQFTVGGINYAANCRLDFSKFPSSNTFNGVYPPLTTCQTIFV